MSEKPPASPKTLGAEIRRLRRERGWTQQHLADLIGRPMNQHDVSALERGTIRLPRRHRLERIAEVFGVPLGELLARSGWADADAYLDTRGQVAPAPYEPLRPLLESIDWDEEAITATERFLRGLAKRDRRETGSGSPPTVPPQEPPAHAM